MNLVCPLVVAFISTQFCVAEPIFVAKNIFPLGEKHSHSSSIVECPDGSLLACWFHGSGERKATDVVVQGARLQKGAREWSPVFQMADTPGFPDCNPVLFVDRQSRLWMFWISVPAERWECSLLKYRRAKDASGAGVPNWTWQDAIQLKPGDAFPQAMKQRFEELEIEDGMWAEYAEPYTRLLVEAAGDPWKRQTGWMTRTSPLTLPTGRILLPLYSDGFNAGLMAISDDDGETWRASEPIVGLGPIQPALARKKDGELVAYCRDSGGPPMRIKAARSRDDGETWTPAIDTDLPNPGSSLAALVLADGRWLIACNDKERGRDRLSILLSADEGKTWNTKRQVEPQGSGGRSFDYPSIIQTRDGMINLTYSHTTSKGSCIRHCKMNTEWLESVSQ